MVSNKISLIFDGYWREANKRWIPPYAGIYCVYACVYMEPIQKVFLKRVLSIGQSDNVAMEVMNADKVACWKAALNRDETLCYTMAPLVDLEQRVNARLALIKRASPSLDDVPEEPLEDCLEVSGTIAFIDNQKSTVGR